MRRLAPFTLALLLLAGCDNGTEPAAQLPERIVLMLGDDGTGRNRNGLLIVRTEKSYPCAGYRLPLSMARDGATLRLNVGAVERPGGDVCAAVVMPAEGRTGLGVGDGTYTLRVERFGRMDTYRLIVLNERTRLETVEATFTRVEAFPEG